MPTMLMEGSLLAGLLALAVVVFLIVVVMMLPRIRRQRPGGSEGGLSQADRGTASRIQQSLERLMLELFDMSRDINAQLQTRIETLNQLIRDADDRINRMKSMGAQAGDGPEPSSDRGDGAAPDGETPRLKTGTAEDPEHREIYELSDRGDSPTEIARQTGRPVGEVQLILDLRKKTQ